MRGNIDAIERFSQDVPNVYGYGHGPYLADVAEAILTGRPGLVEGPEGKKLVQAMTAMYESAAWGGKPMNPGCRIARSKLGRAGRKPPRR